MLAEDPVDLRLEAHVEHPVGLVEDEDADAVERDEAPVDEVGEAARRRDDDVSDACPLALRAERHAAVDGDHREAARASERLELLGHLDGQLARRHEHERRGALLGAVEPLDDGHGEGERLARARGRLREHVLAAERAREHEGLDLEGKLEAAGGEHAGDFCAHAERSKRLF